MSSRSFSASREFFSFDSVLRLDLAHALARDADLGADRLERHRLVGGEAVAQLEHAALAPLERAQRRLEVRVAHVARDDLERGLVPRRPR